MVVRLTDEQRLLRTVSEKAWQAQVEQTLAWAGFDLRYHTKDSRRSPAGFPDVVAIRKAEDGFLTLVVVELKRETGRVKPDQWPWLLRFGDLAGLVNSAECAVRVITGVWKPSDAERITELLMEDR